MKKNYLLFFVFIFLCIPTAFSQLNLDLNATPESCPNNGSIAFIVSGNPQNAPILFTVYKLPETTQIYATVTTYSISGLSAGSYRVIATNQNTNQNAQSDVTITNTEVPLTYSIVLGTNSCNNRFLSIDVTSGTATGYEILSGPVTRPFQTSNTFNGLVSGNYLIRVFDSCGNAVSRSYTIEEIPFDASGIRIMPVNFPSRELVTCNSIQVGHQLDIAAGYYIAYPLTFTYTIYPPNGAAPIVVVRTFGINGFVYFNERTTFPEDPILFDIPYFEGTYRFNLVVTDDCGNEYHRGDNLVSQPPSANMLPSNLKCGYKALTILPRNYVAPLSVNFTSAPAGFVPSNFNPNHPNFPEAPISFGSENNPVPEGNYTATITDACGRTMTVSTSVAYGTDLSLEAANSCTSTPEIIATIPNTRIVSIRILVAPSGYPFPTPRDVSHQIDQNGEAFISGGIVPGNYLIEATDECGNVYTQPITVGAPLNNNFFTSTQGDCEPGFGGALIASSNPDVPIASVIFLSGPSNFMPGYNVNLSEYIVNARFSIGGIPIGTYVVKVTDSCGTEKTLTLTITDYVGTTEVDVDELCSSYNVFFNHTNNATVPNIGYWLQKYDPQTGMWGHPTTGVTFSGSGIPNNSNGIQLSNNTWRNNVNASGLFRIITVQTRFASPSESGYCLRTLNEFTIDGSITVRNATTFGCSTGISDVLLDAIGRGPLQYRIISRDDAPFPVNNQNRPLFTNLQNGIYEFEIEDVCRNILNYTYEVRAPFSFNVTPQLCNNQTSTLSVPLLNYLTYRWYKQGQESTTLSTTSTLSFSPLNLNTHAGTYFVTISYPGNSNSCLNQTLSYTIQPGMNPNAGADKVVRLCGISGLVDLYSYLDANVDRNGEFLQITPGGSLQTGTWDTAGVSPGMFYFNYTVNGFCGETDDAILQFEITAPLPSPVIQANTICEGNTLNLAIVNHVSGNQYAWTGPNNFSSTQQNPQIQNATVTMSGTYTVTVTNGSCSSQNSANVTVNSLPNFTLNAENVVICEGQETTLRLSPNSIAAVYSEINWWFNDVIFAEDTLSVIVDEAGTYRVEVIQGDCVQNLTISVQENLNPFEATASAKCVDEEYILTAFAVDNSFDENSATYEWTGPDNFSGNTQAVNISGISGGIFTVKITDETGCSITYSLPVEKSLCKIPKGISPNDDGKNDTWDLSGLDIMKVKIFNRYGTLVYELNDYVNQWDGRSFNGNLLPTATYFYYLKMRNGEEKTGWVYLNREVR